MVGSVENSLRLSSVHRVVGVEAHLKRSSKYYGRTTAVHWRFCWHKCSG